MKIKRSRKAFTIVELVIVIAVIAILATVLVPAFGEVIQNAKDSAAKQEAKNAYTSYMVENAAKGEMPELFLFQADEDRVVAIQNGMAVGIYATQKEALSDLIGAECDMDKLADTGNGKLFAYGGEMTAPNEPWEPIEPVLLEKLYNEIRPERGSFEDETGTLLDGDVYTKNYCRVVGYSLKKGHTLTINNSDFVFFVRKWNGTDYLTNLTSNGATTFTAEEDMMVAIRIRRADKKQFTDAEFSTLVMTDVLFGMIYDRREQTEIKLTTGFLNENGTTDSNAKHYCYTVNYTLKAGHAISISDSNYHFAIRQYSGGNYNTLIRSAGNASYTNNTGTDIVIGVNVRRPDKSDTAPLPADVVSSLKLIDSVAVSSEGVDGYAHRFTVDAETIDGGTEETRAVVFLPLNYSENGAETPLVMMTHGQNGFLGDCNWYGNTREHANLINEYLSRGYAVFVVNNTAQSQTTGVFPDLGCPQLVDSLWKAYEHIQDRLNVEKQFYIHSRSNGTMAAVRVMRERPELVKCAIMTGHRVSMDWAFKVALKNDIASKKYIAECFGFEDKTGATYEADKLVGYDPRTDSADLGYTLPPTFWMNGYDDGNVDYEFAAFYNNLVNNGSVTEQKTYSIGHSQMTRLASEEAVLDAFAFFEKYK